MIICNMNFYGYSERGMLSSLCLDLYISDTKASFLKEIMSKISFIDTFQKFPDFDDFDIYLEQSFSDFGDSDLLLILKNGKLAVGNIFIEAKVNSSSTGKWKSEEELREFQNPSADKLNSSNLFTQLYHKMALMITINKNENYMKKLAEGITVRSDSSKLIRKLGDVDIIKTIVEHEIAKKIHPTYYVGLIPLNNYKKSDFTYQSEYWSLDNLGFITYSDIKNVVSGTSVFLKNFERNKKRLTVS